MPDEQAASPAHGRPDYWNAYYARTAQSTPRPSQFAVFVLGEIEENSFVVDIGCGSGRDAFYLSQCGHKVLGVDGSSSATQTCTAKAQSLGSTAKFVTRSVSDPSLAETILAERGDIDPRRTVVYARFFVHAITDAEEASFLAACRAVCEGGGILALEFRTVRDAAQAKATPEHFRRFIDPLTFIESARRQNFRATYFVEGFGFAKYKNDDAHVARFLLTQD